MASPQAPRRFGTSSKLLTGVKRNAECNKPLIGFGWASPLASQCVAAGTIAALTP